MPDIEDDPDQRERRFRLLYEEHYRSIQAYAVRRIGPGDDVADVAAEVFTIAWRRLARIPDPPADRLWLYGVARRVVAGKIRSARRFRQLTARLQACHRDDRNPSAPDLESAHGLDQALVHGAMAAGAMAAGTVPSRTAPGGMAPCVTGWPRRSPASGQPNEKRSPWCSGMSSRMPRPPRCSAARSTR